MHDLIMFVEESSNTNHTMIRIGSFVGDGERRNTVELQWLKHLWNHENTFQTGVLQANECLL